MKPVPVIEVRMWGTKMGAVALDPALGVYAPLPVSTPQTVVKNWLNSKVSTSPSLTSPHPHLKILPAGRSVRK